jgi:hypothetical protein
MAVDTNEALEYTSQVIAGYFYTFNYQAKNIVGTDKSPVIYCAYAPPMESLFAGINFHYFNTDIIKKILTNMQKMKNIMDKDVPCIFNGYELNRCFSDIGYGLKMYRKERVRSCYRIKNDYIGEILGLPSDFFMSNNIQKDALRELSTITNKGY